MNQSSPNAVSAGAAAIFSGYRPANGVVDEALDARGRAKPHWRRFFERMESLGPAELARRWEHARRLIRENGVVYNVYGDPRGTDRPWELDAVPVLYEAGAWAKLSAGVAQRARLIDAILADLYGTQRLLHERLVPPELVFAHPAFLRACVGLRVPANRFVHLYGADLGRAADGSLCVINDRAQAPSGAGYALENRFVLARTMPEVFRDSPVEPLSAFFRDLRRALAALAPHRDNPRIVLLTPGPLNETYFEHAYLARYLGITLVEGSDLTVRDERVYLKTLGGLKQVDVIFRRVDAEFCDPLELRGDSFLGVSGLVQAARQGHVAIANALGAGLVESPALMPLLPALCRTLLREELLMPSAETWWCGEPDGLRYVLDHLHELVIKPAFRATAEQPIFGDVLTSIQRQDLAARIAANPAAFVGQVRLPLSSAPALVGQHAEPRQTVLRAYACAAGDGFAVMHGGLARFAAAPTERDFSMQRGGGSKDIWVLSSELAEMSRDRPGTSERLEIVRGGADVPSRVADNLYWLGRYSERAEAIVRLLRGVLTRLVQQGGSEMPTLLRAATHMTRSYPGFVYGNPPVSPEAELLSLVFDSQKPGSVRSALTAARHAANSVRDRLSMDTWHILAGFDEVFLTSPHNDVGAAMALLNRLVAQLSAFSGLVMESMTRGLSWRFLDMGRKLERSLQTGNLLRTTLVHPPADESPLLEAVLDIADSTMTYRRRYMAAVQPHAVLDLLLADESNPRSVAFGIAALSQHVAALQGDASVVSGRIEKAGTDALLSLFRGADVNALSRRDTGSPRNALDQFLNRVFGELSALSDQLSHSYLSHTVASRQLAEVSPA